MVSSNRPRSTPTFLSKTLRTYKWNNLLKFGSIYTIVSSSTRWTTHSPLKRTLKTSFQRTNIDTCRFSQMRSENQQQPTEKIHFHKSKRRMATKVPFAIQIEQKATQSMFFHIDLFVHMAECGNSPENEQCKRMFEWAGRRGRRRSALGCCAQGACEYVRFMKGHRHHIEQ